MDFAGLCLAILAAIFNGSFGSFSKIKPVKRAEVPPPIFNFWTCVGIMLSSLPFFFAVHWEFTPWGILSGTFFVLSMVCTLFAIKFLGLSSASGLWCGTSVVVSFTFGVKVAGDTIHKPGLAAPGLMLLVGGIAGIALNGQLASRRSETEEVQREAAEDGLEAGERDATGRALLDESTKSRRTSASLSGLGSAVAAGVFGGLVLAPMEFAPEEAEGLAFVPSMALGVLIAGPLLTILLIACGQAPARLYARAGGLWGTLAGVMWNVGNICSIVATNNPEVGLSIAYPIMQSGLFVSGLIGVLAFHELRGREQVGYWLSGIVLIAGATMLALSK